MNKGNRHEAMSKFDMARHVCYSCPESERKTMCIEEQECGTSIEYQVGKYTFVVLPVFDKKSDKTIHDIIFELMKKDSGTQ